MAWISDYIQQQTIVCDSSYPCPDLMWHTPDMMKVTMRVCELYNGQSCLTYNNEYNYDDIFVNISAVLTGDAGAEEQVMMPTLSKLVAPKVGITTTPGAATASNVISMTARGFSVYASVKVTIYLISMCLVSIMYQAKINWPLRMHSSKPRKAYIRQ